MIIRDCQGQVIAARSKWYEALPHAIIAEALACRDGADLARNLNLSKVIMETDTLELINLWNRNVNRSCILPVLYQIQDLTRECISFEFKHVSREANMAAHYTAKNASKSNVVSTWMYQVPVFLHACIQHDSHADNE